MLSVKTHRNTTTVIQNDSRFIRIARIIQFPGSDSVTFHFRSIAKGSGSIAHEYRDNLPSRQRAWQRVQCHMIGALPLILS